MLQDAIRASPLFVALPRSPHRSLLVWQHDPWASHHCNQHPPQAKRHQQRTGTVSKSHAQCLQHVTGPACPPARGLVALPACDGQGNAWPKRVTNTNGVVTMKCHVQPHAQHTTRPHKKSCANTSSPHAATQQFILGCVSWQVIMFPGIA